MLNSRVSKNPPTTIKWIQGRIKVKASANCEATVSDTWILSVGVFLAKKSQGKLKAVFPGSGCMLSVAMAKNYLEPNYWPFEQCMPEHNGLILYHYLH